MGGGYSHLQPLPQYTPVTGGNVKINKNHRKSEIVDTFLKMAHMKDERKTAFIQVRRQKMPVRRLFTSSRRITRRKLEPLIKTKTNRNCRLFIYFMT